MKKLLMLFILISLNSYAKYFEGKVILKDKTEISGFIELGKNSSINYKSDKKSKIEEISAEKITHAYHLAMESMATLNKNTSGLLRRYKSHGATDVTGFGILGHA